MNELDKFQIELLTNFERTLQKLIRDRYRKNSAGQAEFVALIEKFIKILSVDPRPHLWDIWNRGLKALAVMGGNCGS